LHDNKDLSYNSLLCGSNTQRREFFHIEDETHACCQEDAELKLIQAHALRRK